MLALWHLPSAPKAHEAPLGRVLCPLWFMAACLVEFESFLTKAVPVRNKL